MYKDAINADVFCEGSLKISIFLNHSANVSEIFQKQTKTKLRIFFLFDDFANCDRSLQISAIFRKSMLLNRMELKSDRSDYVINRYRPIKIDDFVNRDRSLQISANHRKSMVLNPMELNSDRSDHVINRYRLIKIINSRMSQILQKIYFLN